MIYKAVIARIVE